MKLSPAGLVVLPLLALAALACGGGGKAVEPTIAVSPVVQPEVQATSEPTPETSIATTVPIPEPEPVIVPTVRLPEIRSLEHLSVDVEVPPLPGTFARPVNDPALAALIRTTLSGYEGTYSVVVRNLADGRYAALNEGEVYYAASLYKMGVLLEAYRQRDAGEADFSELLTLDEQYVAHDLGTLEYLDVKEGDKLTLADAVKAMIIVSDTPTAILVQDTVGPVRVEDTLRSLGLTDMSVLTSALPTTARDMALLLEAVAAGQGVNPESRREMLALLLQEWIRGGIPAGVPAGTPVAHKTGNFPNASHDVALVWGPAGPYIIAVLSDRSWDWEATVAVSRAVWDYFAANR